MDLLMEVCCLIYLGYFIYKAYNNGIPIIIIYIFVSFVSYLLLDHRQKITGGAGGMKR